MSYPGIGKAFAGCIPDVYDTFIVPLILGAEATYLDSRVPGCHLEQTACARGGSGGRGCGGAAALGG